MNETTTLFLTPEECAQFILFQKHRALIGLLESLQAFDLKDGSIEIHFNRLGEIIAVNKHQRFAVTAF